MNSTNMLMDPIGTGLIPMGSLELRSALITSLQAGSPPSDNLLETQPEQDLVAALILLQHANILHYRCTSSPETLVVYGTNSVFRCPSNLTRSCAVHPQDQVDKVKAALSTVLSRITTPPSTPENMFKHDKEKRLIDIYFDMPSPQPSSGLVDHLSGTVDKATLDLLDSIISRDSPHGMETKLYEYQKKSLWKMVKRELCPGHILDPTVIPMTDAEGNDYYIDFSSDRLGVYRSPTKKWEDVRGGILCEDMVSRILLLSKLTPEVRYLTSTCANGFDIHLGHGKDMYLHRFDPSHAPSAQHAAISLHIIPIASYNNIYINSRG